MKNQKIATSAYILAFIVLIGLIGWLMSREKSSRKSTPATGERSIASPQEHAYEHWIETITRYHLDYDLQFETNTLIRASPKYKESAAAAAEILGFGANLTPFVVKKIRAETDPERLHILCNLLLRTAGINLRKGDVNQFLKTAPAIRDNFMKKWDTGVYLNADSRLEIIAGQFKGDPRTTRIGTRLDYAQFDPITDYGIYALPFVIRHLKSQNSVQFFAAFTAIAITGPIDYGKRYKEILVTPDEKLTIVKAWWTANSSKFDQLHPLYENIRKEVSTIP
jgi:hypothetical protein